MNKKEKLRFELQDKILTYRVEHNLTQIQFSKLCNISKPTLNTVFSEYMFPSRLTVKKIKKVLEEM